MAGAEFVRADLHVHTYADGDGEPEPDFREYVDAALGADVRVLAVTDHNTCRFVEAMMDAAKGAELLVLPGVEISTHDGHLLAVFGPDGLDELRALCNPESLKLTKLSDTERRSTRSMLDLVQEIDKRGGLAIPAHVDSAGGIHEKLGPGELAELLASPALAGLEFHHKDALQTWFTDGDDDTHRVAAWKARERVDELRDRGLARLQSSDAHSPEKVGLDRSSRVLTRLRLDDLNFDAVRLAVQLNPKARCKAEAVLPASYPRILSAQFEGGFLDGVEMEFSPNLNCVIGGRGSGKSTALLAVRAALGARLGPDEDPDEEERMPDMTRVRYIDTTGSERVACRERGGEPVDAESGGPIKVRLADLGQGESGRLARGYREHPEDLLRFLDGFVVRHGFDETEATVLAQLEENGVELRRTAVQVDQIKNLEKDEERLDGSLKAAEKSKVEQIAQWATLLAAQAPMLERLDADLADLIKIAAQGDPIDIDALASEFGVDLTKRGEKFVEGSDGLREALGKLDQEAKRVGERASEDLAKAAQPARDALRRWQDDQDELQTRMRERQTELEAEGLKVQAGAVQDLANRLRVVKKSLGELRTKQGQHLAGRKERKELLKQLWENRESHYQARRAGLRKIAEDANRHADNLTIRVHFNQGGLTDPWVAWLGSKCSFRAPRVHRLAAKVAPHELADGLLSGDTAGLLAITDDDGTPFFTEEMLSSARNWDEIFTLQTMRLEDRPRIEVQEQGRPNPKGFDQLSAGQQRSVLLSLLLCAERSEPLILDQPEDHLDALYIASAIVRHLEAAKERRQVIIATHSPNLTVLGDAELVIPMEVSEGHGRPSEVGAVDRPKTRELVCALLEGGAEAYRKRGERYGFRFSKVPENVGNLD